jgi:exodeoxyribonuclease VII small subunit
MNSEKLGFEAALEELQLLVKKLESGELPLEEALRSFEKGVELTRLCSSHLAAAEQRVQVLMNTAGSSGAAELSPFNA